MTYYDEWGILLDSAYFMSMYYNEENYCKLFDTYGALRYLSNYFEVKDTMPDLPPELHPFCYTDKKYMTFFACYDGHLRH